MTAPPVLTWAVGVGGSGVWVGSQMPLESISETQAGTAVYKSSAYRKWLNPVGVYKLSAYREWLKPICC